MLLSRGCGLPSMLPDRSDDVACEQARITLSVTRRYVMPIPALFTGIATRSRIGHTNLPIGKEVDNT